MSRRVKVELTQAEAEALFSLANCQADSYDDAEAVLGHPQTVAAGYRAIEKLQAATFARPRK